VNCSVAPLAIEGSGATPIDVSVAAVTVRPVDPLIAPEVAVMVALPVAAPVARPAAVIVAFALLELHVTEPVRFCVLLSL
jgi:hypothetical protein